MRHPMPAGGAARRRAVLVAALPGLLAAWAAPAHATPCEQVMAPIEERIRARGVDGFRLEAVDLAASAAGRQVGSCDNGRKKIMYIREAGGAAPASTPPTASTPASGAAPARRGPRVITECADGRVIEGGSCRKK